MVPNGLGPVADLVPRPQSPPARSAAGRLEAARRGGGILIAEEGVVVERVLLAVEAVPQPLGVASSQKLGPDVRPRARRVGRAARRAGGGDGDVALGVGPAPAADPREALGLARRQVARAGHLGLPLVGRVARRAAILGGAPRRREGGVDAPQVHDGGGLLRRLRVGGNITVAAQPAGAEAGVAARARRVGGQFLDRGAVPVADGEAAGVRRGLGARAGAERHHGRRRGPRPLCCCWCFTFFVPCFFVRGGCAGLREGPKSEEMSGSTVQDTAS